MSDTIEFSAELMNQMGVQTWQEKQGFVFATSNQQENPLPAEAEAEAEEKTSSFNQSVAKVKQVGLPFILIGSGLDGIWQNDETLEWQLLKNIAKVFTWDLEQLHYYDTSHLASEEAIYATLDEVMEMEVDWVLSMDTESLLADHLEEGLQIISVSSLTQMLSDPYAKKDCFLTLSIMRDSMQE